MTRAEELDQIRDCLRRRLVSRDLAPPFRASAIVGDTARAGRDWGTAYTRGTTRTRRRAAPVRVGGSRRSTTRTAGARDRGDPEPEPPGRRRGDLVHVGELLPPLLDRLEQGLLDDDDAADLSWWLGGRP